MNEKPDLIFVLDSDHKDDEHDKDTVQDFLPHTGHIRAEQLELLLNKEAKLKAHDDVPYRKELQST